MTEKEEFYIIFDGLNRPQVWDVFYKIIRWCDSYTTFHLTTLEINKDLVHYFLGLHRFINDVEWIYVSIRKPKHRLKYENEQIKIFKEMIIKKFKKSKPMFKKTLPKRLEIGRTK